jgi:photosystem II stability/assembly factor-like uncharacterized protein
MFGHLATLLSILLQPAVQLHAQPPSAASAPAEPYTWRNVVIRGGGFVTGISFHPLKKDLMYARTDVGGAYRWDGTAQSWVPLTDWIGAGDVNLTGIESLAVDPADPNRVYLAAGTYTSGNAAILRSEDQGRTFQRSDVPFKMGGNETGRFNGERLAVDPNLGEIIFFGSRRDGLWKSADRGATWSKVESFPQIETVPVSSSSGPAGARRRLNFPPQPVGIVSVVFDPASGKSDRATPIIYAAVSATESNLLCSTDAGASWQLVNDRPVGLRPNHLVPGPDGMLYLTYGKESGPNTMTDGAVWKWNPKTGAWTDITPVKPADAGQPFGYGAVAVDAQHPQTITVTTFCHWRPMDEIFRSTDGGASWKPLFPQAEWDHSSAPYTEQHKPHWMGDIEINPFNPDQVVFVTGYGIWSCRDVTRADAGRPTHWIFLNDGLEETVPLALISPPDGAHLLSGVGDVDGFRHDDLAASPAAAFEGPRYSNTEDMAVAGQKPNIVVRAGTSQTNVVRAAMSSDGGRTWNALAGEPPASQGAGTISISADGKVIVWTPRRSVPYFTADGGVKWIACGGLSAGMTVLADAVNPATFYACDPQAGRVWISTNCAASFAAAAIGLPGTKDFGGGFGGSGGAGAALHATPASEGELWLASRSQGLFRSVDAGRTFTKLEKVREANSLGFGKAAPGQKHPALFLAGRIGDTKAIFRSDDIGASWVRISDERHQFGWINHVTGDPRIYGRVYFATGGRGIIYGDPATTRSGL